MEEEEPVSQCLICGKPFHRLANLAVHQLKHLTGFDCDVPSCAQPHQTLQDLENHKTFRHTIIQGAGENGAVPQAYVPEWEVDEAVVRTNPYFHKHTYSHKVRLKNLQQYEPSPENMDKLFQDLVEKIVPHAAPEDRIGITLEASTLDFPIIVPYIPVGSFSSTSLFNIMEGALNSNQSFGLDSRLSVTLDHVVIPVGSGRHSSRRDVSQFSSLAEALKFKRSVVRIRDDHDHLCLPTSIIVAIERYKKYVTKEKECYRRFADCYNLPAHSSTIVFLKAAARKLLRQAGLKEAPCGVPELKKLQAVLPDYQIFVFTATAQYSLIFKGPDAEKPLYLLLDEPNRHYHVITKPSAFYAFPNYCEPCNKFYTGRFKHVCANMCHECFVNHPAAEKISSIKCEDCNRSFTTALCFENHKVLHGKEEFTSCARYKRCRKCGTSGEITTHICGIMCKLCYIHYPKGSEHSCFITSKKIKPNSRQQFVFFDIESLMQDVDNVRLNKEHVPNLLVAHRVCQNCSDSKDAVSQECPVCIEKVFAGIGCVSKFLEWLFKPENHHTSVFSHNSSAYDGLFIFRELWKQGKSPEFVNKGNKIIEITVKKAHIRFVDSLNFLTAPLSRLPTMFGLKTLKKGFFPHKFNTPENQKYVGPYPEKKYFCPEMMKGGISDETGLLSGAVGEFEAFYKTVKHETFDLQKELLEYCQQDVIILRDACLQFRRDFIKITNLDPLVKHITLSQLAMDYYRVSLMKEETIARISCNSHHSEENQSKSALQWLLYVEKQLGRSLVKKIFPWRI